MIKAFPFLISCLAPLAAGAAVLSPWYPERALELQARAKYVFQAFDTVQSSHGNFMYHARDNFLHLSALGTLEEYGAELEVVVSDTKAHSIYPDCFKLTGRYQLLNDSVGDPLSLIAGISAIVPTKEGLDDISSFHHGHFETEAHIAAGWENICSDWWTSRYWILGAVGCATDEGSAWFRANFNYETNWNRVYFLHVFVNTLWGMGRDSIRRHDFRGYGSIAHRSVDVGASFSYYTNCGATLTLGYAYRAYAHNFPKNANLLTAEILYPFSL